MDRFRVASRRDRWVTAGYVGGACVVIGLGALTIGPAGAAPFLALTGVTMFALVRWHAHTFGYECPHCGERFQVGPAKDFVSPHTFDSKYLRCPECGKRGWARVLVREVRE